MAQKWGVIQAYWTGMVSRSEDPKLPFSHKTCGDESASHVFKKRCISIQRILLHMSKFRLLERSVGDVGDSRRTSGQPFLPRPFSVAPFYPGWSSLR